MKCQVAGRALQPPTEFRPCRQTRGRISRLFPGRPGRRPGCIFNDRTGGFRLRRRCWHSPLALVLLFSVLLAVWTKLPAPSAGAAIAQNKGWVAADPSQAGPQDFVELNSYIPELVISMPYATSSNLAGRVLYPSNISYLRKNTADKLKKAVQIAAQQGYRLKLWDGYRPQAVQEALWQANPNPDCLVDPAAGYSLHTRGSAVDVTLTDMNGQDLNMPSGYDDFSARADRDFSDVSGRQAADARILEIIMQQAGFASIYSEWWHFNDLDNENMPAVLSLETAQKPDPANNSAITPAGPAPAASRQRQEWRGADMEAAFAIFCACLRDQALNLLQYLLALVQPAEAVEAGNGDMTVRISAIGDCTLGGDYGFSGWLGTHRGDYGYYLGGVAPFLQKDDLTIANLESCLTNASVEADKSRQPAPFFFKGPPEYTQILKSGSVEAVNLANNHTSDYQQAGLDETRSSLDQYGIAHFGYGEIEILNVNGCRVGLAGYNTLGPLEQGTDIEALAAGMASEVKELDGLCDLVIVSFHWGEEGSTVPSALQYRLGHQAIDSGADLVLGHGPHVIQPVETYSGRSIVYSLGNFTFGGNSNPPDQDTFIFTQQFALDGAEIRPLEPEYIPCRISSTPGSNDYRPAAVYGAESMRILARLAW